jgi:hypothetical protein
MKWSDKQKLILASMHAEDNAVEYLGDFSPEVAFVVARNVEAKLAAKWEAEQEEMIRRGDPREVFNITARDKKDLTYAVARIPPGARSDPAAEQHLIDLLAKLPPDRAWWVAHLVAKHEEREYEFSKFQTTAHGTAIRAALPHAVT